MKTMSLERSCKGDLFAYPRFRVVTAAAAAIVIGLLLSRGSAECSLYIISLILTTTIERKFLVTLENRGIKQLAQTGSG